MRRLALLLTALLSASATAEDGLHVLFVGNSLTFVNDLPFLVKAIAANGPAGNISTHTYVGPGGTIAERWADGVVAREMREGDWDIIVLQERGGTLGCLASKEQRGARNCREALAAHRAFLSLAHEQGIRVLLLETWSVNAANHGPEHDGTMQLGRRLGATVVHAGDALHAMAWSEGQGMTLPDGVHPSLSASLVIAAQLCRAITGSSPAEASIRLRRPVSAQADPIDPRVPLEIQTDSREFQSYTVKAAALKPLLAHAARYP